MKIRRSGKEDETKQNKQQQRQKQRQNKNKIILSKVPKINLVLNKV